MRGAFFCLAASMACRVNAMVRTDMDGRLPETRCGFVAALGKR